MMNITLEKTIAGKVDLRGMFKETKKFSRKFDLKYAIQKIEGDNKKFIVLFDVTVHNTALFKLKLEYVAIFNASEEIDESFVCSDFARINAPAIAYPYLRSYVSFLCLNSGFEPAILPTINFVTFSKENFKEG